MTKKSFLRKFSIAFTDFSDQRLNIQRRPLKQLHFLLLKKFLRKILAFFKPMLVILKCDNFQMSTALINEIHLCLFRNLFK